MVKIVGLGLVFDYIFWILVLYVCRLLLNISYEGSFFLFIFV